MSSFSTKSPNIISRAFGDEVVVANCENGLYYSLVGSAADIWKALEAGRSASAIAEGFLAQSPANAEAVAPIVERFIASLVSEELITVASDDAAPAAWSPSPGAFVPPVLDRHDDLKDLLMVDPVHEVTEEGWPHRRDELSESI